MNILEETMISQHPQYTDQFNSIFRIISDLSDLNTFEVTEEIKEAIEHHKYLTLRDSLNVFEVNQEIVSELHDTTCAICLDTLQE